MDKKLKLMVMILAGILLALGIFALILVLTDGDDAPDEPLTPVVSTEEATHQIGTQASDAPIESHSADEPQPSDSSSSSETADSSEETPQPVITQPNGGNGNPPATVSPTQAPTESKEMSFPYKIPGTSLVITKIDSYDGVFLEDGSDRSVTDICALVLTNSGETDVEYADITIRQGNRSLLFKVTVLRAGCTVVVQEASAAPFAEGTYHSCTADVAEVEKLEMSQDQVRIVENTNGSITVTNLTDKTIGGIRVFYKFCLTKGSVYVGGITYTAKVENLAPGSTQTVVPTHYAYGSSEVVMVRLYDSL